MKTIIAAVDFSNATPGVVDSAVRLAKAFGASLRLLHVRKPEPGYITYGFTAADFPELDEINKQAETRANEMMDDLVEEVRIRLPITTSSVVTGDPLDVLLENVRDLGADLVVVGTHGHGAISSLFLGSVAEGMIRNAKVPTLAIPAPAQ